MDPIGAMDEAVEEIGAGLNPGLARLLDELIESAALARPGRDAALHAERLRDGARQLDALAGLVAAAGGMAQRTSPPLRMSA